MKRVAWCGAAVMLGIGLAGCNSSSPSPTARAPESPSAPAAASIDAASSNEVVLDIPGMH